MLSSISWSAFLICLSILLVFYYISIAGLYYRTELMNFMKTGSLKMNERPVSEDPATAITEKETPDMSAKVHELLEELKQLLAASARMKTVREELVMALSVLLRGYPDLKDQPVTHDISDHIKTQCQHICSITLSDAEVRMLWNG